MPPPLINIPAATESHDSIYQLSLASDTTDGQPGHGRTLERMYANLGRKLERAFGRVVAVQLPTPQVLRRRIEDRLEKWSSKANVFEDLKKQWREEGRPEWLEKVLTVMISPRMIAATWAVCVTVFSGVVIKPK